MARTLAGARCVALLVATATTACDPTPPVRASPFGFEASWLVLEDGGYGCFSEQRSETWEEGPRAGFAELGPRRLAADATAWFEASLEAGRWKENAALSLTYPSGESVVVAARDAESSTSFERALAQWFEHFPPGGDGGTAVRATYRWGIGSERGVVWGGADSESEALERMRGLVAVHEESGLLDGAFLTLSHCPDASWREGESRVAYAKTAAELDELPRLLREAVAQFPWRQ